MIIAYGLFYSAYAPSWLNGAIHLMRQADGNVFLTGDDWEIFVTLLQGELRTARPKGIETELIDTGLSLFIKDDDGLHVVASLQYRSVKGILTYNPKAADFFDVSGRLITQEGGEV